MFDELDFVIGDMVHYIRNGFYFSGEIMSYAMLDEGKAYYVVDEHGDYDYAYIDEIIYPLSADTLTMLVDM